MVMTKKHRDQWLKAWKKIEEGFDISDSEKADNVIKEMEDEIRECKYLSQC